MKFECSKQEIDRRKKAFVTLLAGIVVGLIVTSMIFRFPLNAIGYILIAVICFSVCVPTFRFLHSVAETKLRISNQMIERIGIRTVERCLISEIDKMKVKRRINGEIREIYLWLNGRGFFLTAFEGHFDVIKNEILRNLRKNVVVSEMREPMDFDHPLFYPVLGLSIGFSSIYFFHFLLRASPIQVRIVLSLFSVFLIALGVYFVYRKPISARNNRAHILVDVVFGLCMICFGVSMFFLGLNY